MKLVSGTLKGWEVVYVLINYPFVSSQNSKVLGLKVANLKSGLWPLVTALEPLYKTKACN